MPPPYSPKLLTSIGRTITTERLSRYLGATGNDLPKALELYEYNVQLSEALYGILHGLEVAVRNAEHLALTASYRTASWYDVAPLSQYWVDQIVAAKAKPGASGQPGKVVAELTFGFWIDLVKASNHRSLWVGQKLHAAFPNARLHRSVIHDRLKAVHLLRNRIMHHEPVLTTSHGLYNGNGIITLPEILESVEWVCADTAQWMRTQFRYNEADRILFEVKKMRVTL